MADLSITYGIDALAARGASVTIAGDTITIAGIENADEMRAFLDRNEGSAPVVTMVFTALGEFQEETPDHSSPIPVRSAI